MSDGRRSPTDAEPEVDWVALIRSELDSHSPRWLPPTFTPRPQLRPRPARRLWRPLALALAAVLLTAGLAAAQTRPGGVVGAFHELTGKFVPSASPQPTATATPSPSAGTSPRPSVASPSPSASARPSPTASSGGASTPAATPGSGLPTALPSLPTKLPSPPPVPSLPIPTPSLPVKTP